MLKPQSLLPFALHLYLPLNDHIVKLVKDGEIYGDEIQNKFSSKNITILFLNNADREKYNEYLKTPVENSVSDIAEDDRLSREPVRDETEETEETIENEKEIKPEAKTLKAPEEEKEEETTLKDQSKEPVVAAVAEPAIESILPKSNSKEGSKANEFKAARDPESAQKLFNDILSEENPNANKAIEETKNMVEELISDLPSPVNELAELLKNEMVGHSSNVSMYAVLMAIGIGIKDKTILQDIAVAAILHDLGTTQIPAWTFLTPESSFTNEQKSKLKTHVYSCKDVLESIGYKPNARVSAIIDQHHEKFDGTGYPNGIKGFRFDELSQIVAFADTIDSISRGFYDGKIRSLRESLLIMHESEKDPSFPHFYKPELYAKLAKWIKNDEILNQVEHASQTLDQVKDSLQNAA